MMYLGARTAQPIGLVALFACAHMRRFVSAEVLGASRARVDRRQVRAARQGTQREVVCRGGERRPMRARTQKTLKCFGSDFSRYALPNMQGVMHALCAHNKKVVRTLFKVFRVDDMAPMCHSAGAMHGELSLKFFALCNALCARACITCA